MDHQKTDNCAKENVAAEDSCSGDCDDDGQVSERGVRNSVEEREPVGITEAEAGDLRECFHETHHKTGGHDGGKDGDEDVADGLQRLSPQGLLRCSGCLDVVLGSCRDAGHGDELVKDLVDCARADDELQLSVGFEHALDAIDLFQGLLVDFAVVSDDQAKSCRAVSSAHDVCAAADIGSDLFRAFPVIQCHNNSPLIHLVFFVSLPQLSPSCSKAFAMPSSSTEGQTISQYFFSVSEPFAMQTLYPAAWMAARSFMESPKL